MEIRGYLVIAGPAIIILTAFLCRHAETILNTSTSIRNATEADLAELTDIYNYYVVNTHVTFDTEPFEPLDRQVWYNSYSSTGRYRLLVASSMDTGKILGYASSSQLRPKAAYDTSVETSVYLHPGEVGKGTGSKLYKSLLTHLESEDIHRCYGIIALPNDASITLHKNLGFVQVAHLNQVGRKFGKYWDVVWMEKAM